MVQCCYLKFQISFTEGVNRLIYTLRRLPFLGDRISESIYARTDVKRKLGILSLIGKLFGWLIGKLLYFGLFLALPAALLNQFGGVPLTDQMIWSFIVLNCFWGSRGSSQIFVSEESDDLLLNQLHMDPGLHFRSKMLIQHLSQFVFYSIAMLAFLAGGCGNSPVLVLRLMLFYLAFRSIGEAFTLKINDYFGIPLEEYCKGLDRVLTVCNMLLLVLAFGLPVLLRQFHYIVLWRWLLAWPVVLVVCATGILALLYLKRYPRYCLVAKRVSHKSAMEASEKMLQTSLAETSADQITEDAVEQAHAHLFEEKEGYEYLNAIFFHRHKKLVSRSTKIKSVIVGIVLGIVAAVLIAMQLWYPADVFDKYMVTAWDMVQRMLPILVFGMYCASSGKALTKAMFYNCDKSLLKYGYYRTSQSILINFRIRLRYMIRNELPLMAVFSIGLLVDMLLMRQAGHWVQMLAIIVCVILLTIFYSVVYLCMYYIFQPYTEAGAEIGAGYKFCSAIIYIASYECMQIDTLPTYFTGAVLALMVFALMVAYMAAWKLAPRRFVLK